MSVKFNVSLVNVIKSLMESFLFSAVQCIVFKEYLTEENSCFVILSTYLNERLCRHCKFPDECPFPGLGGRSLKPGCSFNFSAVKRSAHLKGVHLGRGALSDNYGKWLWVWIPLLLLRLQISCLFRTSSFLTFTLREKCQKKGVFSGPYIPAFGLNTERYSLSLRVQSECRKIRTRKNSVSGHFSRSFRELWNVESLWNAYVTW